jgi:hypothetical protein
MCQKCESSQSSWQTVTIDSHPLKGSSWVRVIAEIRHNPTGEVRQHDSNEILEDGAATPSVFNWEENNYSCDCNRRLFFERAVNPDYDDDLPCSEGEFLVRLVNPVTGQPYYAEF